MVNNPINEEVANRLIEEVIDGWKRTGTDDEADIEVNAANPFANAYDAATSLFNYTSNLAYSIEVLTAVAKEAVEQRENLDWIAAELWFELRGAGRRSRKETAAEDLNRSESVDDEALDFFNRRVNRLSNHG